MQRLREHHQSRVFGLDVLRAYAILCVVYAHGYLDTDQLIPQDIYNIPVFDGVAMFFVLSGFLIGRILLRTVIHKDFNRQMLTEFWIRRWFRTLPNYMLVLSFLVVATYLSGAALPDNISLYFLFSQNIAAPHPQFFPEAWSITVEEWFYLIIPIPLYLSTKFKNLDRRKLMLVWIVVVIGLVTAFRFYRAYSYGFSTVGEWDVNLRKEVVTRLDSLMFGVLGAYASLYHKNLWGKIANKGFLIGIFLMAFNKVFYLATHSMFYLNYVNLTLTAVATLMLLPKLSTLKRDTGWLVSVVTFISLISYSMYLLHLTPVHEFILPAVMHGLAGSWIIDKHMYLVKYLCYWIITVSCSFLLYRYFERPMTALRDRFHVRGQVVSKVFTDREASTKV